MTNDQSLQYSNWSSDVLREALEAAGVALWSWHIDSDDFSMDRQG